MADDNAPFTIGEATTMQLRDQSFDLDDFGTRVLPVDVPRVSDSPAAPAAGGGIEQRLEELTRAVQGLQRRLDSIDATLARFLAR